MRREDIPDDDINLFLMLNIAHKWTYRPGPWEWVVFDVWPALPQGTQQMFRYLYEKLDNELIIMGPGLAFIYNPTPPTKWQYLKRIIRDTLRSTAREGKRDNSDSSCPDR